MATEELQAALLEQWIQQAADGTISEDDLHSLLAVLGPYSSKGEVADEVLKRRFEAAINSYCHITRILKEYQDIAVELETSAVLAAKRRSGEAYSDDELRLIGKRGLTQGADRNLVRAFWGNIKAISGRPINPDSAFPVIPVEYYTKLTDEQFTILAESIIEQAIVHGTGSTTDKADFASAASECPNLTRRLGIAQQISLITEKHNSQLRYSKLSSEEKHEHDHFTKLIQTMLFDPPQSSDS